MTHDPHRRLPASFPIARVLDNEHACSYLSDQIASMPLIFSGRRLTLDEFDLVMERGLRRSGVFVYYTACPACSACEPTRVDVNDFRWTTSMRRVLNRGDRELRLCIGEPHCDAARVDLFNRHRIVRSLGCADTTYTDSDYEGFLVDSCCSETVELSFWKSEQLVGVSIIDCGRRSLSAVYTYFDPTFSKLSIGSYSILKQFQLAHQTDRQYVYLGMFVCGNPHLNYKGRFVPQQRFVRGQWANFDSTSQVDA